MRTAKKQEEKKPASFIEYLDFYKKNLRAFENKKNESAEKEVRIAFLSSFTANGFKEVLSVKCNQLGLSPKVFIGGYNQYSQEIYGQSGELYAFNPQLIILFVDIRAIAGEYYLLPYSRTEKERQAWVEEKKEETVALIKKIEEKSSAKIVLHNFEVPFESSLKILETKEGFGWREAVEKLNDKIRDSLKNDHQVFVFDYNNFISKIGKRNIFNPKLYYLGDMKFSLEYLPELCEEYSGYIKPLMHLTKKCLVLDLDNTLWGGIIGEDGLNGIKLGPTPEGRPFWEFQKYILSLHNQGVILAINSKNNPADALEALRKHPYSVLKEEHFASIQIDWNDKVSKMKKIAQEINIGLDSLVFIDDDKANREMVKGALPEVSVVEMPEDPAAYIKKLESITDFNRFEITEEDKKKGKMYGEERKRLELKKTAPNLDEYLKGLEIKITIKKADKFNLPRIAQLINKTNQFNTTTIRYSEEEVEKMSKDKKYCILSVSAEDRFGDNGIVGAVIIKKGETKIWEITSFLLSCRVIGKEIEKAILAFIMKKAKKDRASLVAGNFIKTAKNAPAADFFKKNGFKLVGSDKEQERWERKTDSILLSSNFIKIKEK